MSELLEQLRLLLNLPVTANVEAILAELDKLQSVIGDAALAATGFSLETHLSGLFSQLADAKTGLANANVVALNGQPNRAGFVAVDRFVALQLQAEALSHHLEDKQQSSLLEAGLADGRILPAQREYWAGQPVAALSAYLQIAQPVAALVGMQTGGKRPPGGEAAYLSEGQATIAKNLGVDPEKLAMDLMAQHRG